jgi:DNA-directed RNA polymerase subunit RPC12/RpoP
VKPVLSAFLLWVLAAHPCGQTDTVFLDHAGDFGKKQRPGVVLTHDRHAGEYECMDCHHRYQAGENVLDIDELDESNPEIRCAYCHGKKAGIGLQKAFHRQCSGCHHKTGRQKKKTGPRLCGECHVK